MSSLSINEKIAEAMDKLIERRLANEAYDKTLIGTIIAIIESATGHYRVEINSIIYEAYSLDGSRAYEVGDQVYIKIPQGNMDMRKFIEGQVINEPKYEKINKYAEGSPKFEFVLTDKNETLGLIAQEQETEKIVWNNASENYIQLEDDELRANFNNIFNLIVNEQNEYDIVKFSVKLSTKFLAPQPDLGSNYGLKFYFKNTLSSDSEALNKIVILDILNFNVLPWQYSKGYYTQYVRIDKADIEGYELAQISIFQNCLFNDLQSDSENILFKDIAITFEKQIITEEETDTKNYSIQLSSLEKWYNSSIFEEVYYGSEIVNITANLFDSNNKNISEERAYTFHWYKQAIPTESKFKIRDKIAGWGWVPIPQISETLEIQDSTGKMKKKKSLYDGEVKAIKRKYRSGTYEQEKALYDLNQKYGVTVNNVQITPTTLYRNYKVIVTKLNDKKEEEIVAEKEFMVIQDKENLELYLNTQLKINLIEGDNILTFQAEIEGDDSIYLVPYWKIEIYNDKGTKVKTIQEYNDLINISILQNIKYTSYIYQQDKLDNKNKTFIKCISGEWSPKEEEISATTFNLSPRTSRDFTPNKYISDETYIFKSETQEYLTLKDYILSYVKV